MLINISQIQTSTDDTTVLPNISDVDIFLQNLNNEYASSVIALFVYFGVLMLFGLVGNTTVFIVYFTRFKPSTMRIFILAMSVLDLTANVFVLPGEIVRNLFTYTYRLHLLCGLSRYMNSFLTVGSGLILVSVALDRHRKICYPLSPKQFTIKTVKICIGVCLGVSASLSFPYTILYGRRTLHTGVSNITGITCSIDDLYLGTKFHRVYNWLLTGVFVACLVAMIICYSLMGRSLWKHGKLSRKWLGGKSFRHHWQRIRKSFPFLRKSLHDQRDTESASEHSCRSSKTTHLSSERKADDSSHEEEVSQNGDHACSQEMLLKGISENEQIDDHISAVSNVDKVGTAIEGLKQSDAGCSVKTHFEIVPELHCEPEALKKGNNQCEITDPSTTIQECGNTDINLIVIDKEERALKTEGDNNKISNTGQTASKPINPESGILSAIRKLTFRGRHHDSNREGLSKTEKHKTNKQNASAKKKIPASTTLMMFVFTVVFILNYVPHLVVSSLRTQSLEVGRNYSSLVVLNIYHIARNSYLLNCAVNPLVYSFCSARFRHECRNLFTCKKG